MKTLLLTAAVVAGCGFSILFGEPAAPVVFTVAQAEAGRTAALSTCAKCHTEALTGRTGDPAENPPLSALPDDYQKVVKDAGGKVPPLVGPAFMKRWGAKTTADLSRRIFEAVGGFPPSGKEDVRDAITLTAYILQSNGARPGPQELTMSTAVTLTSVAATPDTPRSK